MPGELTGAKRGEDDDSAPLPSFLGNLLGFGIAGVRGALTVDSRPYSPISESSNRVYLLDWPCFRTGTPPTPFLKAL